MVLFGDSLIVEASASGATNTATFLAFGLAPIEPHFIAGHSIGTIWPPTRSWRPKRVRGRSRPHIECTLGLLPKPDGHHVSCLYRPGEYRRDRWRTNRNSQQSGWIQGPCTPQRWCPAVYQANRPVEWCGRFMPQRARNYRNHVSLGPDGRARRPHVWIVDSRPGNEKWVPQYLLPSFVAHWMRQWLGEFITNKNRSLASFPHRSSNKLWAILRSK
jgi:hypothetical protein